MCRRDGGDDGDVRADDPSQRGQFAGMVHPHLEHARAHALRHPRKAQWHAGMIVVALDRPVHPAPPAAVERREQRLLGARLADRSGNADDGRLAARARGAAQILQCFETVADAHMRVIGRLRHDRTGRTLRKGLGQEMVAVGRLALHRDEQVAGADLATVEGDADRLEGGGRGAAGGRGDIGGGPHRHGAFPGGGAGCDPAPPPYFRPSLGRAGLASARPSGAPAGVFGVPLMLPRTPARPSRHRTAAPCHRRSAPAHVPCR